MTVSMNNRPLGPNFKESEETAKRGEVEKSILTVSIAIIFWELTSSMARSHLRSEHTICSSYLFETETEAEAGAGSKSPLVMIVTGSTVSVRSNC